MNYKEGDVLTNDAGEKIILRNNQWVPYDETMPASTNQVIADRAGRTFANNAMALPSASGDMLAGAAGLAQTVAEIPFTNDDSGFLSRMRGNYESQQQQFPANMLRSIPRPEVSDITSAFKSIPALAPGGETPGQAFYRNKAASELAMQQQAQRSPIATQVGNVVGDVASLATGRVPFTGGAPKAMQNSFGPMVDAAVRGGQYRAPGIQRLYRRTIESKPFKSFVRGLGKGAEASLEGAVLAAVKGNDPVTNAAISGGVQLASSGISSVLTIPRNMQELAFQALGLTALFGVAQNFTGDQSAALAELTAYDKITGGITLGLVSHIFGGRLKNSSLAGNRLAEDIPRLADAISSIPRGTIMSVTNSIQSEMETFGDSNTMRTLQVLGNNPGLFPESIRNRLNRALNNGNISAEVTRLMTNKDFTDALEGVRR